MFTSLNYLTKLYIFILKLYFRFFIAYTLQYYILIIQVKYMKYILL